MSQQNNINQQGKKKPSNGIGAIFHIPQKSPLKVLPCFGGEVSSMRGQAGLPTNDQFCLAKGIGGGLALTDVLSSGGLHGLFWIEF